jgi:hypothetical protein
MHNPMLRILNLETSFLLIGLTWVILILMLFVLVEVEEEVVVLTPKIQEHSFEHMVVKAVAEAITAFKAFSRSFQLMSRSLLVQREHLEQIKSAILLLPLMAVMVDILHSTQPSVLLPVVWAERELKLPLQPLQL